MVLIGNLYERIEQKNLLCVRGKKKVLNFKSDIIKHKSTQLHCQTQMTKETQVYNGPTIQVV